MNAIQYTSIKELYYDIEINGDRFSIQEVEEKPRSAFKTLERIERIICSNILPVEVAQQPVEDLGVDLKGPHEELKNIAKSILERYMTKTKKRSSFRRFFGSVSKKEEKLSQKYESICKIISEKIFRQLPNESVAEIFSMLPVSDLTHCAKLSRQTRTASRDSTLLIAQRYGYIGNDLVAARNHIRKFFHGIRTLVKDGHISKEYCVYKEEERGRSGSKTKVKTLDVESTFQRIKQLSEEKRNAFCTKLESHFLEYLSRGNLEVTIAMLQLGISIECCDGFGRSSLARAVMFGQTAIVDYLLDHGADTNTKDYAKNTLLVWATKRTSDLTLFERILSHPSFRSINEREVNGMTPLHFAVGTAHIPLSVIKQLVDRGADIHAADGKGCTPIGWAVKKGKRDVVEYLIGKGVKINTQEEDGYTPLMYSTWNSSSAEITRFLLENGAAAFVNAKTREHGNTALHMAALKNDKERVKLLLSYGADPSITNDRGNNAAHYTSDVNVRRILENGGSRERELEEKDPTWKKNMNKPLLKRSSSSRGA